MWFLRWLTAMFRTEETQSGMSEAWLKSKLYDRSGWEGPRWNFAHKASYDWWKKHDRS